MSVQRKKWKRYIARFSSMKCARYSTFMTRSEHRIKKKKKASKVVDTGRWTEDIKDTIGMKMYGTGELPAGTKSFWLSATITKLCKKTCYMMIIRLMMMTGFGLKLQHISEHYVSTRLLRGIAAYKHSTKKLLSRLRSTMSQTCRDWCGRPYRLSTLKHNCNIFCTFVNCVNLLVSSAHDKIICTRQDVIRLCNMAIHVHLQTT